jgi:hypothetical protein
VCFQFFLQVGGMLRHGGAGEQIFTYISLAFPPPTGRQDGSRITAGGCGRTVAAELCFIFKKCPLSPGKPRRFPITRTLRHHDETDAEKHKMIHRG